MRSDEELWNALSKLRGDGEASLNHLRESVEEILKELGQEQALDRVLSEATCAMGGMLGQTEHFRTMDGQKTLGGMDGGKFAR